MDKQGMQNFSHNLPQYNSESNTLNISPYASFELTVLIIASLQGEMKLLSRYLNSARLIARPTEQKRNKCRYGYSVFFECAIWRANKIASINLIFQAWTES